MHENVLVLQVFSKNRSIFVKIKDFLQAKWVECVKKNWFHK